MEQSRRGPRTTDWFLVIHLSVVPGLDSKLLLRRSGPTSLGFSRQRKAGTVCTVSGPERGRNNGGSSTGFVANDERWRGQWCQSPRNPQKLRIRRGAHVPYQSQGERVAAGRSPDGSVGKSDPDQDHRGKVRQEKAAGHRVQFHIVDNGEGCGRREG